MQIKTISYQRVLNLGNYESKQLELFAEVFETDDVEESISRLAEMVERKIREDASQKIEQEIRQLRQELRELQKQVTAVKSPVSEIDNIPFDSGATSPDNDTVGSF
jgi:protein subunit release factor A